VSGRAHPPGPATAARPAERGARRLAPAAAAILAILVSAPSAAAPPPGLLVGYSFDDDQVASGPDTFAVYRAAQGHVGLSTAFRLSGYRSVEIRDAAGDLRFPELQGYFPKREHGTLYAHFALLTTDSREAFNVALAGPEWFALAKDGIGFWLQGRNGFLYHYSDSMPKKLTPLRPFVWYVVDLTYRVDEGNYDLLIREEGQAQPLVVRQDQANAASQPGSAVDKFSFIGDHGDDLSNVVYYVDDVILTADGPVDTQSFAAPGRRRLYIDAWLDAMRELNRTHGCLPPSGPEDFGLGEEEIRSIGRAVSFDPVAAALSLGEGGGASLPQAIARRLEPIALWARGCGSLEKGKVAEALAAFDGAARLEPAGRLYALSAVLALARLGRFEEADARLPVLAPAWRDDPRFEVTSAAVGMARDDLDRALDWLRRPAEKAADDLADQEARIAEQYFFVLLWKGDYQEAERYAVRIAGRLRGLGVPSALWVEHAADAAFFLGDNARAERLYLEALGDRGADRLLLTKLSDVAYRLGNLRQERLYREKVYGSLLEEER